jgi:alkanesulfonate monooxygenase
VATRNMAGIEVFSTCPPSHAFEGPDFTARVERIARWSERAGCRGILVYTDNSLVDPWLASQLILQATTTLCPLVAIQPIYMHPYTVAKMVTSLAFLHGRRLYLNMVAGGFQNDLVALDDHIPHDERYERLAEYTLIVKRLLSGRPVTFEGKYWRVASLRLKPPLPPELYPGVVVSGSSEAGLSAARSLGATAVKYPKPPGEEEEWGDGSVRSGIRIGVIARPTDEEAWSVAYDRFPPDRKGQITHSLAMKVSDSQWHRQLSELGRHPVSEQNPYWLWPFQNYKTFCPYLVGSYERVAGELTRYLDRRFKTFILDIPPSQEELFHTAIAFNAATRGDHR